MPGFPRVSTVSERAEAAQATATPPDRRKSIESVMCSAPPLAASRLATTTLLVDPRPHLPDHGG
jgi:hypothetical protein